MNYFSGLSFDGGSQYKIANCLVKKKIERLIEGQRGGTWPIRVDWG